MNPFIKSAHFRQKLPGYGIAKSHALNDSMLSSIALNYRTRFLKSFRFLYGNTIQSINVGETIASTKKDGISTFFYWERDRGHVTFHVPSRGVEDGLPWAAEVATALGKTGHSNALLVGEMYLEGKRSRSYEVMHTMYSPKSMASLERLRYAMFDVLVLDKADLQARPYPERVAALKELPQSARAHQADFQTLHGLDQLNAVFQKITAGGEEGVVFYDCSNHVAYKAKPKWNCDLAIVGFVQGTEEMAGKAVSVMGGFIRPDGCVQTVARVGISSPELGDSLLRSLAETQIPSDYMEADSDGRPIVWVRPTLVMEINAEEAVREGAKGEVWKTPVLHLGEKYAYLGQAECVKPIHATFAGLRADKPIIEATFQQLGEETPEVEKLSKTDQEPAIIARRVFTKTVKGKVCVKKVLAWEQNREGYPRYVMHTADFSPNRADSLQERTRVSDDRQEILDEIRVWEEEEITKGWILTQPQPLQAAA